MLIPRFTVRGRHLVAAAALVVAGLVGAGGSAQAAPFAPAPGVVDSAESGVVPVRHWHGHRHHRRHHHHWRHHRHHHHHHHRRHWRA
ncbi:hypothetical protein [Methylobacterium sp. ID0610]|uniref:hypothetical protein n=1 Tax=Methylobacterium carpenticola TaxID=3344827 RepID=UPI00367D1E35